MDRRWLLVGGVALLSVAAGIWFGRGLTPLTKTPVAPASVPTTEVAGATESTAPAEPSTIVVHVAGWVERPGLVEVAEGSRAGDAIAAVGGVRPGVDLDALNLASVLADGQQVVVPGPGEAAPHGGQEGTGEPGPVSLNSADASDLETLPGVGPVLAERIIAHRESHGPFEQVEDLLEVTGIGEAKLGSIRDLVVP